MSADAYSVFESLVDRGIVLPTDCTIAAAITDACASCTVNEVKYLLSGYRMAQGHVADESRYGLRKTEPIPTTGISRRLHVDAYNRGLLDARSEARA